MSYIIATIRLILIAIASVVYLLIGKLLLIVTGDSPKISRFIVSNWAKSCLLILNIRVRTSGERPARHSIMMANHRSYIDIFIVLAHYPASIVAKKELGKWPVIGSATHLARMILVDRGKTSSLISTMKSIKKEIDSGGSVILFPEGGIKSSELTTDFKHGSFKIAIDTDTPIVPAAIFYADKGCYWGDESFIRHFYKQMGKWRTKASFWIGAPIKSDSLNIAISTTKETIDNKLSEFISQNK